MDGPTALADAFLADTDARDDRAELQAQLVALVAAARAEHPDPIVDAAAFCRHFGSLAGSTDALARLHVADAWLAFACGQGDAAAIAALRRTYGPDVERALQRASSTGVGADELQQRVWVKLLADGSDGAPHILLYGGRGSLRGWIRVVVSRMVVDLLRKHGGAPERAVTPEVIDAIARVDPDPQFELWRDRYRDEVRAAMEDAFADLSTKDRRLLRGQLLERLGTDELGAMFGVHRTTAARWAEQARVRLMEGARASLRTRVGGGERTVRSLVAMVRSQLELSVARLLASDRREG